MSDVVRFGRYALDVRSGELRKDGLKVRLQQQPLRILEMLLRAPGQVVLREELRNALWRGKSFGDFEHGLNKAVNKLRESLNDSADNPVFVETVARRGYRFLAPVSRDESAAKEQRLRLAVQPFEQLGDDSYFGAGLTEELTVHLGRDYTRQFAVVTGAEAAERADVVVQGTVRRANKKVRVSIRVVSRSDDAVRWAESYEESLADEFRAQLRIVENAARSIALSLMEGEQALAADPAAQARELCVRGCFLLSRNTEHTLLAAKEHFEQALLVDSECGRAYASLTACYMLGVGHGVFAPLLAGEKAKLSAEKALQLDQHSAEAWFAKGLVDFWYEHQFERAQDDLKRAFEFDPTASKTLRVLAEIDIALGRFVHAEELLRRAAAIEPHASANTVTGAYLRFVEQDWSGAIVLLRDLIAKDFYHYDAHVLLGRCMLRQGEPEMAEQEFEAGLKIAGHAGAISGLGCAYALAGREAEARQVLHELTAKSAGGYRSPHENARLLLALGEHRAALDEMERAASERSFALVYAGVDPDYDPIRSEPRFQRLLSKLRLASARKISRAAS